MANHKLETRVVKNIKAHELTQDLLESDNFPICLTTTYHYPNAEIIAKRFRGEDDGMIYSRLNNPTTRALGMKVAALEGAESGLCFSTGMSAITNVFLSLCNSGNNVIVNQTVYGGTHKLINDEMPRFGITARRFENAHPEQVEKLIDPKTAVIFVETPSNPTLGIVDIAVVAKIAKKHNIPMVVDNTFCTPILQNPIALGADIVIHSATKYMNGNASLVAGIAVGNKGLMRKIYDRTFWTFGATLGAFDAGMLLMSLQSLAVRMNRHCESAMIVAKHLESHPKVARVHYPGLTSHPQHEIAKKQMRGFGGILAFEVKGDKLAAQKVVDSTHVCERLINLGQNITTIVHNASTTHSELDEAALKSAGISESFIRLSVGLEAPEDIIADLDQALAKI
ncbi:MAG: aminotransferase class I/II-fold pyridoxal phosphate-dependent enzyme [Candidatus Micrarchaeota archaeon]